MRLSWHVCVWRGSQLRWVGEYYSEKDANDTKEKLEKGETVGNTFPYAFNKDKDTKVTAEPFNE